MGPGSTVTIAGGEIRHCTAFQFGGGMKLQGHADRQTTATITKCNIHDCTANTTTDNYGRGGGIDFAGIVVATIEGDEVLIHNNFCQCYGGGIQLQAGPTLYFKKGKIYNNRAIRQTMADAQRCGAAGIHSTAESKFIMTGGEIYGNYTIGVGGAIHTSYEGTLEITGGKIYGNHAGCQGGAINLNTNCNLRIPEGSTLQMYGNTAGRGGAVCCDAATVWIYDGLFHDNHAVDTVSTTGFTKGTGGAFELVMERSNEGGEILPAKMLIYGGEIYNNTASVDGGAIHIKKNSALPVTTPPSIYIYGGKIYDNIAYTGNGGAIYADDETTFNMEANEEVTPNTVGEIYGNEAKLGNGGAVYLGKATVTIKAGSFSQNTAKLAGGGFFLNEGDVTISGGSILGNTATNDGGGFYVAGGNITITGGEIKNNIATTGDGGGFYVESGITTINHSAIKTNYAQYGAGLYVNGALDITDTEISGNQATYDGGGVYSNAGELTIHTGVIVTGNHVQQDGGGFFVNDGGNITMAGGSISGNSADRSGGGIYTKGNFNLGDGEHSCTLNGNTAGHNGGAVYVEHGKIVIKNALVSGNTANGDGSEGGGKGGGIYCGGTLTLNSGTIEKNGAREGGGIFMATEATMTFYDGIVKENTAVNGGGVYNSREATLNLIKSAQIINNKCYNNYDGGMGGGIYQNGFLNVAGTELKVQYNQSVSLSSTPVVNNVFLPEDGNFITVVDWEDPDTHETIKGLSGSEVWIGISVPTVPHAVVHSDTPDADGHIKDFYDEVGQAFRIFLKDDINRYSAVYADRPYPYNHNDIFFTGTWQIGALDLVPDIREFSDDDLGDQAAVDAYFGDIDSEGKLARFMCYVNGLDGYSPHPAQSGKVTADLYMEQYVWLPIGADDGTNIHPEGVEVEPYTGTFDGNGHIISGLKTIALAGLKYYGLFGRTNSATVKNTFAIDCSYYSNSADDRIGCIIGEMTGGKLYYSEGEGKLSAEGIRAIMGGLVGYAENAEIHSCMAMPAMECNGANAIMGGLVGKMFGNGRSDGMGMCRVYNCFANPQFRTTSSTAFGGGLAGVMDKNQNYYSFCEVTECYVRLDRLHQFPETNNIGALVGDMVQTTYPTTMRNVFFPVSDHCGIPGQGSMITKYRATLKGEIGNFATYAAVSDPGSYYYDPSQDTYIAQIQEGIIPCPEEPTLLPQLQIQARNRNWVADPADRPNPPICYWKRTGASSFMASGGTINGDYPILDFDSVSPICGREFAPAYIALGSRDGIAIDYCPTFSDMLQRYNKYEGGGTINLFHSADNTNGTVRHTDDDVRLYIDEGITILQGPGSHINAVSYQTLQHSTDYWHTFSTVMGPKADASGVVQGMSKIGIKYGKLYQVPHNFDNDPCDIDLDDGNGAEANSNSTLFPYDTPVENFDFYSFYEPQYHWINFKRNSSSHWHMDNYEANIAYDNETYLIPGKGYLIALSPEMKIYEYGTLNCGEIRTGARKEDRISYTEHSPYGPSYSGYNLLGNPYQAYLDFDRFVDQNEGLWSGTSGLDKSYYAYDAELDAYVGYSYGTEPSESSCMPSKWLAPHQGFFIVKSNTAEGAPTTARFIETGTDGMCSLTGDGTGALLRGGKPSYKLVNLRVADESGHADVASIEFGRPDLGGAAKQKTLRTGKGAICTRYEGADYAMLFLDEDVESLPLHFDCTESGTYTLSWNTANGEFVRLTLVDNLTGVSTDCLSHDSYVFEASPDDYSSRFKLVFQYAIDDEEDEETAEGNSDFVFVNNGDLIVNGAGDMELMDVNGHVLFSTSLSDTQSRVGIPDVATGIYLVRLNEKVQKIVIR